MRTHRGLTRTSLLICYLSLCMACGPHSTAEACVSMAHGALRVLASAVSGICPAAYANVSFSVGINGASSIMERQTEYYTANPSEHPQDCTYEWHKVSGSAILYDEHSQTVRVSAHPTMCNLVLSCTVTYDNNGNKAIYTPTKTITVTPDPSRRVRQSKPAIWINYADPRPKGDDADNGAKPSFEPNVAVNNVSITPAVSQYVLPVPLPGGAFDLSLNLTFSPATVSRTLSSSSVSFSPSPFGYGWSDNLTPCAERFINTDPIESEHTFSFSGGTLPSASFVISNNVALAEPLTRADYANDRITFWPSGQQVDFNNAPLLQITEANPSDDARTCYWPRIIYDRNTNSLHFSYQAARNVPAGYTVSSQPELTHAGLCIPTIISNNRNTVAVKFEADNNGFVTQALHCVDGVAVRTALFFYTNIVVYAGQFSATLLSKVILPDGGAVQYHYIGIQPEGSQYNLPCISSMISPAGTTSVEYVNWVWNGNERETQKYEPTKILVIVNGGAATQTYERTGFSYDMHTRTGSAVMQTTTDTGTINQKYYALILNMRALQWYGCETDNTLDTYKQHHYALDSRFRYTSVVRYPTGLDGPSDTTSFAYDDHDNLTSATDPYNNNTCYFYAPNKLDQTCVSDPRGVISSNIYDACGNLLVTIEDCGDNTFNRTSSNLYNTAGQVITSFDPLGRISRSFYSINRTAGPVSSYDNEEPSASDCGFLVATRDAEDRVTTYSYDALGRQIVVNAPGNSDSARYATTNTYDIMDRTTATRFPDGTYVSNVFNAAGYPVRVRDRAGRWTDNTYDDAGHLVRVDYPNNDWVKKEYTGNLVSKLMDAAANTTEYFYCREQLTGVRFPDGSTRAAGFDNFNRQIWAVDERGVAVTNAYDKLDRVIASAYVPFTTENEMPADVTSVPASLTPSTCNWSLIYGGFDNQVISYAYDKVGNLTNLADWAGTLTNAYDHLNRSVCAFTECASPSSLKYSLLHNFDLAGNITTQTFDKPSPGRLMVFTTYTYDELNRLKVVHGMPLDLNISCLYHYNANGKLDNKLYYENGAYKTAPSYSYDGENRLIAVNGVHCSVSYSYNNAQQIVSMHETISGTERQFEYQYDNRDQLTREVELTHVEDPDGWLEGPPNTYTYDHAQNRVAAVRGGTVNETYGYSIANKMTNIWRGSQSASSRYWYDLAGNLATSIVKNVTNCYYYNVQNKLVKIVGTNFVNEFKYNSRNERIALGTSVNGSSMSWRYDACQGPVTLAEFDSNSSMTRWYVRGLGVAQGIGDVIAEVDMTGQTPKPHYYLSNHRGDTLVVLNPDGAANSTFRYDAFGNCYEKTGPFTPRYTFSTKEYLSDTHLYLYAYRVYDPVAGRWTQRDPIDYEDSINLYCFCRNNPINMVDPLGDATWNVAATFKEAYDKVVGTERGKQLHDALNKKYESIIIMSSDEKNKAGVTESADGKSLTIVIDPKMPKHQLYKLETPRDPKSEKDESLYAPLNAERLIAHELGHFSNPTKNEYENINENENKVMSQMEGTHKNDRDPMSHGSKIPERN